MIKKDVVKRFAAGVFFLVCVILIVGFVFFIGADKGFTEPKFRMTALFRNVGGLSIGAPVRLSGVTVGTVADINFLPEEVDGRGVRVDLSLYRKYEEPLRKSARISIITEGVIGEKVVEITADPDFRRQDLNRPVVGEDPLDVQNLAVMFGDAAQSLSEASRSIDSIIAEVKTISSSVKRVLNRVEQRLIEGNLFKVF